MRNWHPLLADTLRTMSAHGSRRAIGFIAAAHRSYSSCTQYRQNVVDARTELVASGRPTSGRRMSATGTRTKDSSRPTPRMSAAARDTCRAGVRTAAAAGLHRAQHPGHR